MTDLENMLRDVRNNIVILDRRLQSTLDTPTWIKVFPLLDQLEKTTEQIELQLRNKDKCRTQAVTNNF